MKLTSDGLCRASHKAVGVYRKMQNNKAFAYLLIADGHSGACLCRKFCDDSLSIGLLARAIRIYQCRYNAKMMKLFPSRRNVRGGVSFRGIKDFLVSRGVLRYSLIRAVPSAAVLRRRQGHRTIAASPIDRRQPASLNWR